MARQTSPEISCFDDGMSATLTGRLLVATPLLIDPNFSRTVVYLIHHDEEGAFGVVVNRPSGLEVATVLSEWADRVCRPAVVFVGGPVSTETAIAIRPGVETLAEPIDLSEAPDGDGIRIFAGYSGWGPDQLEDEMAEGSWLVGSPVADDLFGERPDLVFGRVVRRIGPELGIVATLPADPNLN